MVRTIKDTLDFTAERAKNAPNRANLEEFGEACLTSARRQLLRYQNHSEYEDMVQEAVILLMDSLTKWDPNRGVLFSTFTWNRMRTSGVHYHRKYMGVRRQVQPDLVPLYNQEGELLHETMEEDFSDESHDSIVAADILAALKDESEDIQEYVRLILLGWTDREARREMGLLRVKGQPYPKGGRVRSARFKHQLKRLEGVLTDVLTSR